ncbi:hypothetical protein [Chryseolinea sp. H1M3-3]|uniref:hypothetical protein n=1 Tax=Chryseolinea sp. H1M3-3 TaxID=3034144 RepID=UPI0023EE1F3C|nr:hypothetical protein [Chryseolinea sp. H1M3-3]
MKPLLSLFFLGISFIGNAQVVEIPEKEFVVSLSSDALDITRGQSKKMEVRILKSRAYQKGKMKMGISTSLPAGIKFAFNPESGNANVVEVTITALPEAVPGVYAVIVNSTVNYKTKGSILKLTVE